MGSLYQEALSLHRQNEFAAAEEKYQEYLLENADHSEAWLNLGILYYEFGDYQKSQSAITQSLELDALNAIAYYSLGCCLQKVDKIDQAILAYQDAIALDPTFLDAYNNLGNVLAQMGEISQAEAVFRQAIASTPNDFGSHLNLGNILMAQNQIEAAIEVYQTALTLSPENPDALHNLEIALNAQKNPAQYFLESGHVFYSQGRYREAVEQYRKFSETNTGDTEFYFVLSECLRQLNREEEAILTLEEGIRLYPTAGQLHFSLITILVTSGQTQAAIASAENASRLLPNDYTFKIWKNLMVPTIYDTPEEIDFYRQRFIRGLQTLIQQTRLETPDDRKSAVKGIGCLTNFHLAYQARNDVDLQRQYGNLVHQIMAANYSQWMEPLPIPPLKDNRKIRVGYLSAFLHSWSGTFLSLGWLRHCNRQNFEIYCYYIGNKPDPITQQFQAHSDVFHHIPENLEAVCQQVLLDQLDILVFPELGMDAPTIRIASLRLAPVQCVVWGHPVTSGLPTIDYFLSSELMEPENAQSHYSETLIGLPNIGVSYPKPFIAPLTKTRADFQLRSDAIVYLTCQAPYKYLPQYDYIFPEIARRVPQAQFMFLRAGVPQKRLQRAFAAVGLNSEDYCVCLPVLSRSDYLMLNLLSDVYLDTLSWSGGNTTLDAVACNLPIVTCPGEFMRGRHSYAILKMLGVTDTIAQNEAEYLEIAVKLGLDLAWRREIVEKIKTRHDYLYDDKACVIALEAFYQQVVQANLNAKID